MTTKRLPGVLILIGVLALGSTTAAQTSLPPEVIAYPDAIVFNGKVLTADEKFTIVEAVAIRDGKFLATGTNQRILAMAGPNTKKYDLKGRSAMPGFVDTHLHQAWVTSEPSDPATRPRLRFDTLQNMLDDLKQIVAKSKPGEFISLSAPTNRVTTIEMNKTLLDQVAPNNPLYIETLNDQVVCNSLALKMLLESSPNVAGIMKGADGQPNGQLRGAASGEMVWVIDPWPDYEKLLEPQKAMLTRMNQLGLTTIMGRASPLTTTVLTELNNRGELTTRVRYYHEFLRQNDQPERFLKRVGNLTGFGSDLIKIVGTTVQVVDGGGAASAKTLTPKLKAPETSPYTLYGQNKWEESGNMATSDRRNIILANRYGWTIGAMHSSGDESNTLILEAYAEANKDRPLKGRHFGIDHGELLKPKHFQAMIDMGVTPSVYSKAMYGNEDFAEVFGRDALFQMQPVKSLINAGIRPAAEADAGGAQAAPLFNMKNWITRIDDKGFQLDPKEKASREEALWMYTLWAAAYAGEEKLFGSIEPGKLADLVVTASDYMTYPERDLDKLRVLMTMVGGKVVYEAPGSF